jgi:O-antigen ligase
MARWAPLRLWTAPALLAGLTVGLGFHAGGFFARSLSVAAVALAIALAARLALAARPLEGMSRALAAALAAIVLFAAWTLLSSQWSGAGFRSLTEADRVLLYALALAFFGSWARSDERVSATLKAMLIAFVVLCGAGLISRLAPDVWQLGVDQRSNRLQYPVTYANTMGLLAALGLLWALALSANACEPRATRILAAAAVPLTASTLVLTYSRGAILALVVGLVALLLLGRTRAMLSAVLAVIAPTAAACLATFDADLLATTDYTSQAALDEGHRVALVIVAAAAGAALLRSALLAQDDRPSRWQLPARWRRGLLIALASASAIAIGAVVVTVDLPQKLSQRHERFHQADPAAKPGDVRDRLTDPGSSERLDAYRVALRDFKAAPLHGRGAGTFVLSWNEQRAKSLPFNQAHSLYLQMLGELGLVGLGLIGVALLIVLAAGVRLARGPERPLYAAVFAGGLAWAVSAAIDWQWQMPVVTLCFFALGGAVLAAEPTADSAPRSAPWPLRIALVLGLLALVVMPARVTLSDRSLTRAVSAFRRVDCPAAISAARDARRFVDIRPEPHELLAYCAVLQGHARLGLREARRAVELDPDSWLSHYALALVQGSVGVDPRASIATALRLNQYEPLVYKARERFVGTDPAGWRRQAAASPITFDYGT